MKDNTLNNRAIWYCTKDNVATALSDLPKGSSVVVEKEGNTLNVLLKDDIPKGHKFSVKKVLKGNEIIKYKESIGTTISDINAGMHVHVHNLESCRARGDRKGAKS